jgi:hypothetical protein
MIIIISTITILVIALFFAKKFIIKRLQCKYEKSLLNGDRKKAVQSGKNYYLSLNETTRKSKGVVDIEAKISEDFRAFNSHRFPILL